MNDENLKPVLISSTEEAKRLGRLGGLSRSPKKKLAAQLRELRKRGQIDNFDSQRYYDILKNSELNDLELLIIIEKLLKDAKTFPERAIAFKLALELRKIHHGVQNKLDIHSQNLDMVVQAEISPEEIAEIVRKSKERTIVLNEPQNETKKTTDRDNMFSM